MILAIFQMMNSIYGRKSLRKFCIDNVVVVDDRLLDSEIKSRFCLIHRVAYVDLRLYYVVGE